MESLVYNSQVYVGTYAKYNNGSIDGAWIALAGCKDYEDFLAQCGKVHKDEREPEFMIQDTEDMPDGLTCMEWMDENTFNDIKRAMYEQPTDASAGVKIVEGYSPKSFQVVGDTKPIKDDLKRLGGVFNGRKCCWFFSNKKLDDVKAFLSGANVPANVDTPVSGDKFTQWLEEYAQTEDRWADYVRKNNVGAVKIRDRYILLEKPGIETRFCFHDEGPQYEFYCDLMKDNKKKLQGYFLSENREVFERHIDFINEHGYIYLDIQNDKKRAFISCHDDVWGCGRLERTTAEETALILEGLKFAAAKFEKRLQAYLKRYGVSKLHTWTYWADA